jgi:prolyl oligopeptidase
MVMTADHDDRVVPAHSFKFISTLQKNQKGNNPVFIRIETNAGHGAGTSLTKSVEQIADVYSFIFYNTNSIIN